MAELSLIGILLLYYRFFADGGIIVNRNSTIVLQVQVFVVHIMARSYVRIIGVYMRNGYVMDEMTVGTTVMSLDVQVS